MKDLFVSGRIVDAIVVFMAIEASILVLIGRRRRGGPRPFPVLAALLPGLFLLLALRIALRAGSWRQIAVILVLALAAHLLDLSLRWGAAA
ncbi:MAG: hypothetical protein KGL92_08735 [Gammaproteobacteria bacterium]|nr:hypothetical protein [Gammaproteobacteria bacterium]MDE2348576.1 hypothetical protein [Gammaproteobacteria bacterium]